MMISYCSRPYLNRILFQSLVVGTLAAIGLLSGVIPELSKDAPTLVFSSVAYAEVSPDEIDRYAQAAYQIEQLRQSAYEEIKRINGAVPEIVCSNPASLRALPRPAQRIARSYCNQSSSIVANFFPRGRNRRFNEITNEMQRNPRVRTLIQRRILELQR